MENFDIGHPFFSSPDTSSEPPDFQHLGAPEHWRNEVLDVGRAFHQLIHDLVPRVMNFSGDSWGPPPWIHG